MTEILKQYWNKQLKNDIMNRYFESKDGVRMETENGRHVNVKLHSTIKHDESSADTHELTAKGKLIEKGGKTYLRFEESQDGQKVHTTVKLDEEDTIIMRSGAVNMRLPFTAGSTRLGSYGAGPASFNLFVKTERLQVQEGSIFAHYTLHADDTLLGTHELTITYTEVQS